MQCVGQCPNQGRVMYPVTSEESLSLLTTWRPENLTAQEVRFDFRGNQAKAILLWPLLNVSSLEGRCAMVINMAGATDRCSVAERRTKATRFSKCSFCYFEAPDEHLNGHRLLSLPHLAAQDVSVPRPERLSTLQILTSIKVVTPRGHVVTLLQQLLRWGTTWMVTTRIPKPFVLHVFQLAMRCPADCTRLVCGHRSSFVTRAQQLAGSNDLLIRAPGMVAPWVLVHNANGWACWVDLAHSGEQELPAVQNLAHLPAAAVHDLHAEPPRPPRQPSPAQVPAPQEVMAVPPSAANDRSRAGATRPRAAAAANKRTSSQGSSFRS